MAKWRLTLTAHNGEQHEFTLKGRDAWEAMLEVNYWWARRLDYYGYYPDDVCQLELAALFPDEEKPKLTEE